MNEMHNDLAPEITLGEADHAMLNRLAMAGLDNTPELSDQLLNELDRAHVVADAEVPQNVARMGSRVVYRTGDEQEQAVILVYPAEADIAHGRISVMTPIGTALIGLRQGQSITWRDRANKRHMLTVVAVETPAEPASA